MPQLKSDEISKGYYHIGEVASYFHLSQSRIRFYMDMLPDYKLRRKKNGARLFTPGDILVLKWIIKASNVYHLNIIQTAFSLFPASRFKSEQYLTHEELTQIINYNNHGFKQVPTVR